MDPVGFDSGGPRQFEVTELDGQLFGKLPGFTTFEDALRSAFSEDDSSSPT